MPNSATEKVLKDLESSGFDLSSVRKQMDDNPLLDRQADSVIGGGILRRQEFTSLKEQVEEERKSLARQAVELAANQDNLKSFEEGSELYKAALEIIEVQRENLIKAGYDPEEVRDLSLSQETNLKAAINKGNKLESENQRGEEMPNENKPNSADTSDFVRSGDLNQVLGNVAGGALIGSLRAQRQIARAEALGIEVTDALIEKYEENLVRGLKDGKNYEAIADETFGMSAKRKEKNEADFQTRVEEETRKRVAEALKDAGVSTSTSKIQRDRSIYANLGRHNQTAAGTGEEVKIEGSAGTKNINNVNVPVNQHGEIEFYKMRGNRAQRVQTATNALAELEEKRPELFDDIF